MVGCVCSVAKETKAGTCATKKKIQQRRKDSRVQAKLECRITGVSLEEPRVPSFLDTVIAGLLS